MSTRREYEKTEKQRTNGLDLSRAVNGKLRAKPDRPILFAQGLWGAQLRGGDSAQQIRVAGTICSAGDVIAGSLSCTSASD